MSTVNNGSRPDGIRVFPGDGMYWQGGELTCQSRAVVALEDYSTESQVELTTIVEIEQLE